MSTIYEVLQLAHRGRLAMANELNDQTTPPALPPLTNRTPVSIPRFHEESELHKLAQSGYPLYPTGYYL
jgi:hypothetical protein